MFRATPAQQQSRDATGRQLTTSASHSVGVEDGGPGLPITGWSTEGGDLRIGHFLGVHALQAIPLLALGLVLLARRFPALRPEGPRVALVFVGSAAYAGLIGLVTWQALRGESHRPPGCHDTASPPALLAAVPPLASRSQYWSGHEGQPSSPRHSGDFPSLDGSSGPKVSPRTGRGGRSAYTNSMERCCESFTQRAGAPGSHSAVSATTVLAVTAAGGATAATDRRTRSQGTAAQSEKVSR